MFRKSIYRASVAKELAGLPKRRYRDLSLRSISTKNGEQSSEAPPPHPPRTNTGKIVGALALLAIGSTYAYKTYTEKPDNKQKQTFNPEEVKVIFVLGGPGSGKGTQCGKLVAEKGFVHLSAGDLLRAEQQRKGSKYGELIAQCIKEGTIVPQEVTVALLQSAIASHVEKGDKRFLVDGFPRKMDQALTFEDQVVKSAFTLFFECPESVMLDRLLERGKTSGRTDDNIESIKKRFRTFIDTSMPVVDHFEKQGKVVKLSCDDPVDVVYGHVKKALANKGID